MSWASTEKAEDQGLEGTAGWGLGTVSDPLLPPGDQCSGGPTVGRLSLPQAGGAGLGWGSTAGV